MKIYSHSRLRTFEQCHLKYKYKYIDKIIVIKESIESFLGKIVHSTLEWLYTQVKNNKIPAIDEVITCYTTKWQENYNPRIVIVKKELTATDYFNKGIQFLTNYYTKHHPFDDNTIEIEKRIIISLDKLGEYKIRGFIDRVVHNLNDNRYEVHDYKTSNFLPTQESIDNDRQLGLYSIAIKDLVGKDNEVLLVWHYLAHNTKIHSKRTNEQLQKLKDDTIALIKQIEATKEFPSNKSILCDWCEYNSMCSEFKNKSQDKTLDIWD